MYPTELATKAGRVDGPAVLDENVMQQQRDIEEK